MTAEPRFTPSKSDAHREPARQPLVALVNSMPDGAFTDTERQFRDALAGSGARFELYTLTAIPRAGEVAALVAERYRPVEELLGRAVAPDALIITGTEPTDGPLEHEPCFPQLRVLLEWASRSVEHAMLSCLAAHASLLLFDGLERQRRPAKLSGLYDHELCQPDHPLARGLAAQTLVPHSRANDVAESELAQHGYDVILRSPQAGWAVAARRNGRCLFVLCQGHPEYSALSLLREYRRDVRRSLESYGMLPYPELPEGYLTAAGERLAARFREYAAEQRQPAAQPPELYARFPFTGLAGCVRHGWRQASSTFYANWAALIRGEVP